MVTTVLQIVNV